MKKFLSDKENATILTISVIAFIIGCLAINPIISFLIIGVADFFLFLPDLKKKIKSKQPSKKENLKEGIKDKVKKDKKEKDPKKKSKKKIVLLVILGFIILCFILGIIFMIYIAATAPKFDPNKLYKKESSIIYDKNGKQIASLGSEKREKVNYNQLPDVLVNAIVATEDSRFFKHNGFDLPRFLKASIKQVTTGGGGGASTLTMQVSKNNYTSTTTSGFEGIKRKFTDIYLSIFQIERKYSKKEIMEFYVNAPYLGSGAYGVEQACQTYFGKSVNGYEFILMNKWHEDESGIESEKIFFDKIEIKDDTVLVKPTKFYVEIGRTSDDVLQDIYYHEKYGMFFPVCSKSNKARVVLYHISNESVKTVMESDTSSTLKPDFAIIINKSKNFVSYETESMDIEKKSGKMIICGNFRVADGSEKGTEKDSFQIFNTLTFV